MMIANNLTPAMNTMLSAHAWRQQVCWYEAVDNILKAYLPIFQHVYEIFAGTMLKPG